MTPIGAIFSIGNNPPHCRSLRKMPAAIARFARMERLGQRQEAALVFIHLQTLSTS
jgi:hypothetical protein